MNGLELLNTIVFTVGMIWFLATMTNIEREVAKIRRITEDSK